MSALIWIFWILSLCISTVFMSLYVRKYHKSEGIIAIYVIYLALSQILASKIIAFGSLTTPAAVLIYPFVYQLTDTMNEHFGKKETLKMIVIAFVTQVLMVIFIYFGNALEPASFWWIDNEQWLLIFAQTFGITAASWISFLITGYLDTIIFDKIKEKTGGKHLWIRSIASDIPMLFLDSLLFVSLAFGVFGGQWDIVIATMTGQILTKWLFGIVDTPFIYLDRYIVEKQ